MNSTALTYFLIALAIALVVALAAAVFAGVRMWQLREKARDDLDPTFRPPSR